MLQLALCDDEPAALEDMAARLGGYLEEKGLAHQISCFADGAALLASGQAFDLLFLDVQMAGPDGMETARQLRERGDSQVLIFMSVLAERVFDAFAVQAFDYLVKPVEEARLRCAVDRALAQLSRARGGLLLIQRGVGSLVLPFAQIMSCEVVGRKIYLRQQGGETIDYYDRMEALEQRLDSRFFRCHRSYLINLDYVRGYRAGLVTLSEGGDVPVSRLREQALTLAMLNHMKERRR